MKHLRLPRLLPWLLIAVCPPLLGRCGGATETGNPPVVEQQRLHVVLHEDGVEVVGDPGAVSPGGRVVVTNVRTGDRAEATARTDGSVSVSVPGTAADEYEVTVSTASGSQSVRVSTGESTPPLDCRALRQQLGEGISTGLAAADHSCQTDADCVLGGLTNCYPTCISEVLSAAGKDAAQASLAAELAPLCSALLEGCGPVPDVDCIEPDRPVCRAGTCVGISPGSCDDLQLTASENATALLQSAPRACSANADCAVVQFDLPCFDACGTIYSAATAGAAPELQAALQQGAARDCGQSTAMGCQNPPPPPCLPAFGPPVALCVEGLCDTASPPPPVP